MTESGIPQRYSGSSCYLLDGLQRTPPATPSVQLYATLQSTRSSRHSAHVGQSPLVCPFVATPLGIEGGGGGGVGAQVASATAQMAALEPPFPPEMHTYEFVSPRHSWAVRETPLPSTGALLYSYANAPSAVTLSSSAGSSKVRSGSRRREQHANSALYNPSLRPIQSADASSTSSEEPLPIRNIKEDLFRQQTDGSNAYSGFTKWLLFIN